LCAVSAPLINTRVKKTRDARATVRAGNRFNASQKGEKTMTNDLKETLELMRTKKSAHTDVPRDSFDDEQRHKSSFESHPRPQLPKDPPPPK